MGRVCDPSLAKKTTSSKEAVFFGFQADFSVKIGPFFWKNCRPPVENDKKFKKKQPSLGYFRPFKAILGHSFSPFILVCNSAIFVVTIYLYVIPTYILVLHTKIYVPLPTNRNTISYMHRIPNSLCLCIFFLCMYVGGLSGNFSL